MVGFTSVSLRPYSTEEVVAAAKEAGAEFIEWGSDVHVKTPADARKAKKLCDENGIIIRSYGSYYRTGSRNEKEWQTILENADCLGAKVIRTWLGTKGSAETSPEEYLELLADARYMADTAAKYGITVSHECHPNTYNDTTETCLRFLRDADKDNLKTYYQSWYRDESGDKEKLIKTLPFVTDIHLSFSELVKFQQGFPADEKYIEKIISWAKELHFNGNYTIEFVQDDSPENLKNDIIRLKELL